MTGFQPTVLTAEDYAAAERLIAGNLAAKAVFGHQVKPQAIDGSDRFWYRLTAATGARYMVCDPAAGTTAEAFDHDHVAAAMSAATGQSVYAGALPFLRLDFPADDEVGLHVPGARFVLDTTTGVVTPDSYGGLGFTDSPSPDGRWAAFAADGNLCLRDLSTGEVRQLTTDGSADQPYATNPDGLGVNQELEGIGFTMPPPVKWSADSTRFVTHRLDNRGVARQHFVSAAPHGGGPPTVRSKAFPVPGDETIPTIELIVIDVASDTVTAVDVPPIPVPYASPVMFGFALFDGDSLFLIQPSRDSRTVDLLQIDPSTGTSRVVLTESGDTPVDLAPVIGPPIARVAGDDVIWWSQASGWGHLYVHDRVSGDLVRQLTDGDWLVSGVVAVDDGWVWFSGMGREDGDPYRSRLYRVPLVGGEVELIDGEDADHTVLPVADGRFFVDTASTETDWGRTVVRDRDGDVVLSLATADASRLTGFRPPLRERLLAADGETEIWASVFLPAAVEPDTVYPVLDDVYPGPQVNRGTAGLATARNQGIGEAAALASLGFIVVHIDGRGTPLRSKAFHDHSYGHIQRGSDLDDHVAALAQLAERYPLDLDRVGIFGSSGGGYASTRAMFTKAETYKAAVSACGNHDQRIYHTMWGERYHGMPDEVDYDDQANTTHTDGLTGKLLLIHGELDDNVTPSQTLRVVDKLVAADADFDMLLVPGAGHGFIGKQRFVIRRRWDYLVRHVMGAEPPTGFHLEEPPLDLSRLFG